MTVDIMGPLRGILCLLLIPLIVGEPNFSCAKNCRCYIDTLTARCNALQLTNLTNTPIDTQTLFLDLSHNKLRVIPPELKLLSDLRSLHLQNNHIGFVAATDFDTLFYLEYIDLSANYLGREQFIDVIFIRPLRKLQVLDISFNNLRRFPDFGNTNSNIKELHLANCSIRSFFGSTLKGLDNLRTLTLANNPIDGIHFLKSKTLATLNISDCNVQQIVSTELKGLPALQHFILTRNYQLKNFTDDSDTIIDIDLTDCNLEKLPTFWFPNLTSMNLQGNRIQNVEAKVFRGIPKVQTLILSNNAITYIDVNAFKGLQHLAFLDLSYNRINLIAANTFERTPKLGQLLISHNYIKTIKWRAPSLNYLEASHCEILQLGVDDLKDMYALLILDISYNWLSTLPNNLIGENIRIIDARKCGIWKLTNETFANLPHLHQLRLQGNRLSSQIGKDAFHNVKEIYLGDNPWRCDCQNPAFRKLYFWLTEPGRIVDNYQLMCQSPAVYEGQQWYLACGDEWNAKINVSQIWIYASVALVMLIIGSCILWQCLRKCDQRKKREEDVIRRVERQDAQVRLRRMRLQAVENLAGEDRNAPDPRDIVGPPTYEEALILLRSLATFPWPENTASSECSTATSTATADQRTSEIGSKSISLTTRANKRRRLRPRSSIFQDSAAGTSAAIDSPESCVELTTSPTSMTSETDGNTKSKPIKIIVAAPEEFVESSL